MASKPYSRTWYISISPHYTSDENYGQDAPGRILNWLPTRRLPVSWCVRLSSMQSPHPQKSKHNHMSAHTINSPPISHLPNLVGVRSGHCISELQELQASRTFLHA
ncbi:hypothetical protein HZ326_27442 [Fusarium oxysporum f. sp. albedinis]|nr:hypothetical protein HZ326_27442 [Fusarium oxysporum f. sp. albedinis]